MDAQLSCRGKRRCRASTKVVVEFERHRARGRSWDRSRRGCAPRVAIAPIWTALGDWRTYFFACPHLSVEYQQFRRCL